MLGFELLILEHAANYALTFFVDFPSLEESLIFHAKQGTFHNVYVTRRASSVPKIQQNSSSWELILLLLYD